MYWKVVDERLIRRGEILLNLEFLDGYEEVAKALETAYRGLSKAEAERRLREFGPNKLEETST